MSKVLVVEDEPALLDCYRELVVGLGHECITAHDGDAALAHAREQRPDLVMTDLMLPRRSGLDVIRALRTDPVLSDVPVVLLSAGRPSEAEQREAWAFLPKPVNIERFEQVVRDALSAAEKNGALKSFRAAPDDAVTPITLVREAMLSWVAHEIKSPLSAALVACQMGTRSIEHGEEREMLAKRFAVISRQLMRMDELVTSILDAAQLQDGKLALDVEEFELGEWLGTIAGFWRELHPDYRFPVRHEEPLHVRGDKERLRQILDNLVSNAVKYGGPSKTVRIDVSADAGEVRIGVTDDGRGIPREALPQIFNRFHRVAGQGGRGHGLGLYIAAALARLHGGELTVDSLLERGSTFTLRLPRQS